MSEAWAILVIGSVATFGMRLLPFLVFRGREVPESVQYVGSVLPVAVMVTLVVYTCREANVAEVASWVPGLAGVTTTAVLHWWRRNVFLSIVSGTAVYMVLTQAVFG